MATTVAAAELLTIGRSGPGSGAVASAAGRPTERSGAAAIRSFQVDVPDEALEHLRRRIAAIRLPSRELVDDRSQGVQLATIRALAR